MYKLLICFTNSKKSPLSSCDKYLNSLSERFLTGLFRIEFINCMLRIIAKLSLIVKNIYFSKPFGGTFNYTSNLLISCMIK